MRLEEVRLVQFDLSIQLRSPTSFRGNTQPMVIVDGVIQLQDDPSLASRGLPGSDLDINPEDIESLSILKGAAAAALYGSRAADGVVIITTKKGAEGKVTVKTDKMKEGVWSFTVSGDAQVPVEKRNIRCVYPSNIIKITVEPKEVKTAEKK